MIYRELPHRHGAQENNQILREDLARTADFQTVSNSFRLLSDPTRIRIFWLLCHCEECVINISAMMEMSSPAVSHHLRALRENRLIVSRRVGKEVYYKAAGTPQSQLLHRMIEQVMAITCPGGAPEEPAFSGGVLPGTPARADLPADLPDSSPSGEGQSDLCCSEADARSGGLPSFPPQQLEAVRQIHARMVTQIDRRFTIEELSREYLMNPTTLKTVFKAVYGNSIAAHIHEHRMEQAARLLRETNDSAAEIAHAVGYENQSKFSAAFKEYFGQLPTQYRRSRP